MRRWTGRMAVVLGVGLGLAAAGCSSGADVAREELAEVVERDGIAFPGQSIPAPVLERLAVHQVVVLGETHHLREHWEFTAELLGELHGRGFRQLLVEQPQMADWWLEDYVAGGDLMAAVPPPANWQRKFTAIRQFNETLPAPDRIHVRAIDVNADYYGGAPSFRSLILAVSDELADPGPVTAFLAADYATPAAQTESIGTLLADLEGGRAALVSSWGQGWYDRMVEMAEVERASIAIRSDTDGDRASRAREDVIKQLADARIAGYPHGTVINIGGNHAQKTRIKGTDQEWLGDYLVHRSGAVEGTVTVVGFTSARTELLPGAGGTPWDVRDTSPEHELFRVMAETWPDRTAFLPLDDPVFAERTVAVNYEETIYAVSLREVYDAVVQYGVAHRMPSD